MKTWKPLLVDIFSIWKQTNPVKNKDSSKYKQDNFQSNILHMIINKRRGKSFTSPGANHKQARQKSRLQQPAALHALETADQKNHKTEQVQAQIQLIISTIRHNTPRNRLSGGPNRPTIHPETPSRAIDEPASRERGWIARAGESELAQKFVAAMVETNWRIRAVEGTVGNRGK
jgi:hypothetical protein